MAELHKTLDRAKHGRFDLCGHGARVFRHDFPHGVCQYNGWIPADQPASGPEPASCALSRDQIKIGESLLRFDRLLVLREEAADQLRGGSGLTPLDLKMFGYGVAFTGPQEASGRFGNLARGQALRRCWDFSSGDELDAEGVKPLWTGYARHFISGYAPRVCSEDLAICLDRYPGFDGAEFPDEGQLKTLDMIACEDREASEGGDWIGINALGILKGDVDNLGEMFRIGLGDPTFAKTASLSRQLNAFFAIYLPWLLARKFPSVYTVFAGGDDFLLIAPWRTAQKLAATMREEFGRYAAANPEIHFSAGIATQKPGAPIAALAELAEDALEAAKGQPGKNAMTCFDETVPWKEWPTLEQALKHLDAVKIEEGLSSGYVYRLLHFVDMCAKEKNGVPEAGIWRAQLKYATRRYIVDKRKGMNEQQRQEVFMRLVQEIGGAIAQLESRYRIVLFNHLYRMRTR
jgi:CRISPR-associated protein Csm1